MAALSEWKAGSHLHSALLNTLPSLYRSTPLVFVHFQSQFLTFLMYLTLFVKPVHLPLLLLLWQVYLFSPFLIHLPPSLVPTQLSLRSVRGADRWWSLSVWLAVKVRKDKCKGHMGNQMQLWQKFIQGSGLFWQSVRCNGTFLSHVCQCHKMQAYFCLHKPPCYMFIFSKRGYCAQLQGKIMINKSEGMSVLLLPPALIFWL